MISNFKDFAPQIHKYAYVHPASTIIGQVEVGRDASIWPGVVMRGDMGKISIGESTSIQDNTVCHMTHDLSSTIVGAKVTVGHGAILHGCIIEDKCLIGMGAILLDNCFIGTGSFIGAGSLVTAGTKIPPGSLVMGSPAKVVRPVSEKETQIIEMSWAHYVENAQAYSSASDLN